jgi:predicted RNA-binding protein with PUA-like domain
MTGTRRSTRQTTTTAPKYNDDSSSSSEKAKSTRNAKKATRQKRTREQDVDEDAAEKKRSVFSTIAKDIIKDLRYVSLPPAKRSAKSKSATGPSPKPPSKTIASPAATSNDSNRNADGKQEVFWLLKAEPLPRYENGVNVAFSIDDLAACTEPEPWSGVRNPQARNNMQAMRKGDLGFFYHSNAKPSGVVGLLRVVEEAKVDETAFDKKDPYYDPKNNRETPKWFCVGVEYVKKFDDVVDLKTIKDNAAAGGKLKDMQLITNGRLSVCRVRKEEWDCILDMAEGKGKADTNAETSS